MLRPEPRHENMAALFISIIGLILYVCKTRRESLATCNCGWEFALGLTCHGLWVSCCPREVQQCFPALCLRPSMEKAVGTAPCAK